MAQAILKLDSCIIHGITSKRLGREDGPFSLEISSRFRIEFDPPQITAAIVGAQKCGTTSLAYALSAHPEICLAKNKEAHLFDDPHIQSSGIDSQMLSGIFEDSSKGIILLDATPSYLYLPGCLDALALHNPRAKIIVIVRDPGDRVVSHYYHSKRNGCEQHSLPLALTLESRRLAQDADPLARDSAHRWWSYRARSRYEDQVRAAVQLFGEILLIRFETLVSEPGRILSVAQNFLNLEVYPLENHFEQLNTHGIAPKHRLIRKIIRWLHRGDQRFVSELLSDGAQVVSRSEFS